MRRLIGTLMGVLLACAAAVLAPAPAHAHSDLVEALPGPGDKVAAGVAVVALAFTSLDADAPTRITVAGPDAPVATGASVLVDDVILCAAVEPLEVGVHGITYEATSADGAPVTGRFLFEVTESGRAIEAPAPCQRVDLPAPSAAAQAEAGSDSGDRGPVVAVAVGLLFAAGMAVVVLARLGARRQRT